MDERVVYSNRYPQEVSSVLWTGLNVDEVFNFIKDRLFIGSNNKLRIELELYSNEDAWSSDDLDVECDLVISCLGKESVRVKRDEVLLVSEGVGMLDVCDKELFETMFMLREV